MERIILTGTCSTGGAATIVSSRQIYGKLHAVRWIDGTLADGVDAVLSVIRSENLKTLLTLTNANDDATYYPLVLAQDNAGANLTAIYAKQVIDGYLQLAITSGGNGGIGGAIVYIDTE